MGGCVLLLDGLALKSEHFHLLVATMQPSESKHFLKAILPPPIHAIQLRIPEEFIKRFGNELSTDHDATISVPDGRIWNMGLKRCGEHVFFCNNWEEFATYYSISYGSYLVFKYEGNSKFSVVIFDATSAEIPYPLFNKTRSTNGINGEPNYTKCSRKRSNVDDADLLSKGGDDGKQVESRCNRNQNVHTKRISKSASERAKNVANEFKPKNPSFTSTIKLQHRVCIPAEFAPKYLNPNVPVKLLNSNGKQWQVSCIVNRAGSSSMIISRGFPKFAKDNDLSEGDTCVFELINKSKPVVLQVTAFRAVDYGN